MVRWIKLKEFDISVDTTISPSDEYVAGRDGTISKQDFRIRTDGNGFMRSGQISYDAPPIILLGDSASESLFISEDRRLGAQIEGNLRLTGKNVNVLMNAMSNCTTLHATNIYLNKCIPLKPRALIYMNCGTDAESLSSTGLYWVNGEGPSEKALNPIAEHRVGTDRITMESVDMAERIRMLSVLNTIVTTYGGRLVLVTVPSRATDAYVERTMGVGSEYYRKQLACRSAVNEATRAFAEREGVLLLDIERRITSNDIFYDTIHMNEHGCGVVGKMIADALVEAKIVE